MGGANYGLFKFKNREHKKYQIFRNKYSYYKEKETNDEILEIRDKLNARFFFIRKHLVDIFQKIDFCFDNLEIVKSPVIELIDFVVWNFLEDDYKTKKLLNKNKIDLKKLFDKYNNYEEIIKEMKKQIDFREK